jgi:3'-phosphoadenosine 5'-phosphosulfate (PAPS) 3'-phosphatase
LEQAGGAILDFAGEPLSYRTGRLENPPFVAMGDPAFAWRDALEKLKPHYKKALKTF